MHILTQRKVRLANNTQYAVRGNIFVLRRASVDSVHDASGWAPRTEAELGGCSHRLQILVLSRTGFLLAGIRMDAIYRGHKDKGIVIDKNNVSLKDTALHLIEYLHFMNQFSPSVPRELVCKTSLSLL